MRASSDLCRARCFTVYFMITIAISLPLHMSPGVRLCMTERWPGCTTNFAQCVGCTSEQCACDGAAGDTMWQRVGLSVGCLVNALRAHRDALAAGGHIPAALGASLAWAWPTETPPPAGSALAALRHYAVELLAAFRCAEL